MVVAAGERNYVIATSTLDGVGGENSCVMEDCVVPGPSLVEDPLLGYKKPKICHERAEERAKACDDILPNRFGIGLEADRLSGGHNGKGLEGLAYQMPRFGSAMGLRALTRPQS